MRKFHGTGDIAIGMSNKGGDGTFALQELKGLASRLQLVE
jgi:hypothetical protein